MSSRWTTFGLADDGVVTKSVNKVLVLAVATTWEKRDLLTGVKYKGRLQLMFVKVLYLLVGGRSSTRWSEQKQFHHIFILIFNRKTFIFIYI
jgi:hypothetical protein